MDVFYFIDMDRTELSQANREFLSINRSSSRSWQLIYQLMISQNGPTNSSFLGSLRLPGPEEPCAGAPHGGPQGDHTQDPLREVQVWQAEGDDGRRRAGIQGRSPVQSVIEKYIQCSGQTLRRHRRWVQEICQRLRKTEAESWTEKFLPDRHQIQEPWLHPGGPEAESEKHHQ